MRDTRIVYGANCSWWDSIDKVSSTTSGLPACPRCHGVLFETESETQWWEGVDRFEADGNPGYRAFIEWLRGRCHPRTEHTSGIQIARATYDIELAEQALRKQQMAEQSFDLGKPGLNPHKNLDVTNARQLVGHLVETTATHSRSRGWIPTIALTITHVPLVGHTGLAHEQKLMVLMELDAAQAFIDVLIDGLSRAIDDTKYGLREL